MVEFRARGKHSRASWETVSRGTKLIRAVCKRSSREVWCQHLNFLLCFSYLRPERCPFGIRYRSLSASSLGQTTLCFAESLSSHFYRVSSLSSIFCLGILMLVNTSRHVDHNLWPFEPINQIISALVNSILFYFILPRLGFSAVLA